MTRTAAIKELPFLLAFTYFYQKMVKPELRTAIASHSILSVLKRYTKLVEIGRLIIISPMPPRFRVLAILTKRSLFIDNLDC